MKNKNKRKIENRTNGGDDVFGEFYAETFNMFKNPVVWKKHQRQEMTEINIMGNILPPFLATGRFVVSFDKNPPRYRMTLRVTGQYVFTACGPPASNFISW